MSQHICGNAGKQAKKDNDKKEFLLLSKCLPRVVLLFSFSFVHKTYKGKYQSNKGKDVHMKSYPHGKPDYSENKEGIKIGFLAFLFVCSQNKEKDAQEEKCKNNNQ